MIALEALGVYAQSGGFLPSARSFAKFPNGVWSAPYNAGY